MLGGLKIHKNTVDISTLVRSLEPKYSRSHCYCFTLSLRFLLGLFLNSYFSFTSRFVSHFFSSHYVSNFFSSLNDSFLISLHLVTFLISSLLLTVIHAVILRHATHGRDCPYLWYIPASSGTKLPPGCFHCLENGQPPAVFDRVFKEPEMTVCTTGPSWSVDGPDGTPSKYSQVDVWHSITVSRCSQNWLPASFPWVPGAEAGRNLPTSTFSVFLVSRFSSFPTLPSPFIHTVRVHQFHWAD